MPKARIVKPTHLPSFDQAAKRAGVISSVPVGVRPILVKRIVGSAGKATKLGRDFLPLASGPAWAHYRGILAKMQAGEVFPPITVYQLRYRYYVLDGHTRVAAAKELGVVFIDAQITEALPSKEGDINLTYYARKDFERSTGLEGVRLTAAWRYHLLQRHIEGYRLYLEHSREGITTLPEAARIWLRTQYWPTVLEIRRRKLTSTTGGRTAGDVYTDILQAWDQEANRAFSMREMLDLLDQSTQRGPLTRAKRMVTGVVDASLPKAVPPLTLPSQIKFADQDVEDDLAAGQEAEL